MCVYVCIYMICVWICVYRIYITYVCQSLHDFFNLFIISGESPSTAVLPLSTWVKTCLDPLSHNHMFFLNLLYTQYTHIWPYWPYPHYYPLLWLLENFQGLHSPCFFTSHTLNVNLCYTNFGSFSSLYQLQISIESPLGL